MSSFTLPPTAPSSRARILYAVPNAAAQAAAPGGGTDYLVLRNRSLPRVWWTGQAAGAFPPAPMRPGVAAQQRAADPAATAPGSGARLAETLREMLANPTNFALGAVVGSEGDDHAVSFYVPPGVASTRDAASFRPAVDYVLAELKREYDHGVAGPDTPYVRGLADLRDNIRQWEDATTPIEWLGHPETYLERVIEHNPASRPAITAFLASNLRDIKMVVLGSEDHPDTSLHPVLLVGTAPDGSIVGFRGQATWT